MARLKRAFMRQTKARRRQFRQRFGPDLRRSLRGLFIRRETIAGHFDRVAVIHLARLAERRPHFERELRRLGIQHYSVVDAADGLELDLPAMIERGDVAVRKLGRYLAVGEAACLMSHRMAWEAFLASDSGTLLVLEDDFGTYGDSGQVLNRAMAEMPADWDIIHFSTGIALGSGKHGDPGRLKVGRHVYRGSREAGGTVGYALTRRAAAFLLAASWPLHLPADWVTAKITTDGPAGGHEAGLRGYIVFPPVVRAVFPSKMVRNRGLPGIRGE